MPISWSEAHLEGYHRPLAALLTLEESDVRLVLPLVTRPVYAQM
jgi:hypothetical protein